MLKQKLEYSTVGIYFRQCLNQVLDPYTDWFTSITELFEKSSAERGQRANELEYLEYHCRYETQCLGVGKLIVDASKESQDGLDKI